MHFPSCALSETLRIDPDRTKTLISDCLRKCRVWTGEYSVPGVLDLSIVLVHSSTLNSSMSTVVLVLTPKGTSNVGCARTFGPRVQSNTNCILKYVCSKS